ncbi:hypothetical protein ACFRMQ_02030 [Kitasatospora sp. NPDC056783]|uniref:hypothetical protein n=1 Tax=Kitasatospora sp. NPDC056783 TaxID=3345943 RepID=UPI0036A713DC
MLLVLATGCGGGGGSSSGTAPATPATTPPTAPTAPTAPTSPTGSNPSPKSIASLFPGSKGGTVVTKAKLPATPLGGQTTETVVLAGPLNTPDGGSTKLSTAGTTIGAVHLPAGSFSVADNPCTGRTLQPGDTCAITVAFAPTTVGTHSAELTVDTSAADTEYRTELIGEGVESNSSSPSPSESSLTPGITSPAASPSAASPSLASPTAGASKS